MATPKRKTRWTRKQLVVLFLAPLAQIYLTGCLISIAFSEASVPHAMRIPYGWIEYWISNGLTQNLIRIGVAFVVGGIGIAIRSTWMVAVSTVVLSLFLAWIFLLTNMFLIFGAPGSGG